MIRRTRLPRRSKPIPRGGRPKARNANRRVSEFARCYHSRARVAFVKRMPCFVCAGLHPLFAISTAGASDNAHSETGATGWKAGYETIVPLCREHHRRYDEHRTPCDTPAARDVIKAFAARVEAAWQAHCAGGSGGGGTPE